MTPNTQFWFSASHSTYFTSIQIYQVVNIISMSFKTNLLQLYYLDVLQAFNCVWHKGLPYELKKCLSPK